MGFSPSQVDAMSIWQFMSALDGWRGQNDPDDGKRLTADEEDSLWEFIGGGN